MYVLIRNSQLPYFVYVWSFYNIFHKRVDSGLIISDENDW